MANSHSMRDSDTSRQLVQKMNQTLSNGIVQLLRIIMSPMSKQEQQREALSSLRTNPGLLLALLKIGLDNVPADNLARLLLSKSGQRPNRNRNPSTESSTETPTQSSAYIDESATASETKSHSSDYGDGSVNSPTEPMCYEHKGTNTEYDIKEKPTSSSHTRSKLKRKRKTKDIGQKEKTDSPSSAAPKKQYISDVPTENGESSSKSMDTDSSGLKENLGEKSEKLMVRKLMDILMNPPTIHHQQTVLAVLRSDEKLRNLFFKEKEILSKMKIPVFKNATSEKSPEHAVTQSTADSSTSQTAEVVTEPQIVSLPDHTGFPVDNSTGFNSSMSESEEAFSNNNLQQTSSDISALSASEEGVFDSALHDHFIDLSQELHMMNNIHFAGGHMVGFTMPTADHDPSSSTQTVYVSESDSKELVAADGTSNSGIDFMHCL